MTRAPAAAGLVLAACSVLLGACAAQVPLLDAAAAPVELDATPFFPQLEHQCGPAALATVLGASGVAATPAELTSLVYLPGRKGSLQVEMQAAPRRYGRIAYALSPQLAAITGELDAGRPVLVLHNYGLPAWPRWHYAVVVGHDPAAQQLMLRSGETRRQVLSAKTFMRAWDNAGRWAIVLLQPGELPRHPDRARYLEAASAFERVASPQAALQSWEAAVHEWPADAVPWVGRGTARFRLADYSAAAADYRQALERDPSLAGARNNLAMALLEQGCAAAARREMALLDADQMDVALREAVADTQARIATRIARPDAAHCIVEL